MRQLAAVLGLACLTGCVAMSPAQVREGDRKLHARSTQPPAAAAGCVARNIENANPGTLANIRQGSATGSMEIVASANAGSGRNVLISIVDVTPAAAGSNLTFYFQRITVDSAVQSLFDSATSGC